MKELISRPSVLEAVLAPKPWGWELWLTSTRPEAPAGVGGTGTTLADLVAAHPEVLGVWARRLFGDAMPIFAKLIHTDFPPRVHMGFRRTVERGELLAWLDREQDLMRRLLPALRIPDAGAFATYHARYSTWATEQALAGWRRDDDATTLAALGDFVEPALDFAAWIRAVRANRSVIAGSLGEIDLRAETGNFLLSPAGIVHAIFGLSLQTHPLDPTRALLQALFAELAERGAAGASDDDAREDDRCGRTAGAAAGAPRSSEERGMVSGDPRRRGNPRRAPADLGHDLQPRGLLHSVHVGGRSRPLSQRGAVAWLVPRRARARTSRT